MNSQPEHSTSWAAGRFKWPWLTSSKMVLAPAWRECFQQHRLDSPKNIMDTHLGTVVAADRKGEKNDVLRVELTWAGRKERFFIKRYFNYSFEKIRRRAFRGNFFPPSVVRKEYQNLQRLGRWGFDVPEMVGYGEFRYGGGLILANLISREIPDVVGLDELFRRQLPTLDSSEQTRWKRSLADRLADLTRRMHDHGFEHHDLFFRNVMVSKSDPAKVYILDCPRGYWWPRFFMRWRRIQDLATLDAAAPAVFTRTQRLRFFLRYRGHRRLTSADKGIIRRVLAKAEPWRQRQTVRLDRLVQLEGI